MSEERKYWVPALEKADKVIALLAAEPARHKLIDLSRRLDINKSSMFSLLNTMEALQWAVRGEGDTYSLGRAFAVFGSSYVQNFDLNRSFQQEAAAARDRLQETIQLARLDGNQMLYLGKLEAPSPVRLQSEPGMRLPAHVTALGKAMLSAAGRSRARAALPRFGAGRADARYHPEPRSAAPAVAADHTGARLRRRRPGVRHRLPLRRGRSSEAEAARRPPAVSCSMLAASMGSEERRSKDGDAGARRQAVRAGIHNEEGDDGMRLKDKVILITGSGSGIGKSTALLFASEGAKLIVNDLSEPNGTETVNEIEAAGGEALFIQAPM